MIKKNHFVLYAAVLFAFFFLLTTSCEPEAPRIRSAERKIIDSLYNKKVAILKVELDSMCQLTFDKRVDQAVDSIMAERIAERKRRLGY